MKNGGCQCCAPQKAASQATGIAAVLPALGLSLLAAVACPCCWVTWGGIIGSTAVAGLAGPLLLPLTAGFLALGLVFPVLRAVRTGSYLPFGLALLGAVVILVARISGAGLPIVIAGALLLLAGTVWSSWKPVGTRCCA